MRILLYFCLVKMNPVCVLNISMDKYLVVGLLCILMLSCNKSSQLEVALQFAGDNRPELEKVLDYYKNDPNQLKLKAAKFLIENMPYHFTYTCEEFEAIKKEMYPVLLQEQCTPTRALKLLEKKYGQLNENKFRKILDIHVITSEYLIDNIECSFKIWQESPWGKSISFETFCEEILPYRIGNEALESWKKLYYEQFQPVLAAHPDADNPVKACQYIYDELSKIFWRFDDKLPLPHLGASILLENRFGGCLDRCDLVVYAMRSVGIPCGIDFIVQSPEKRNPHHYWNYMRNEKGRCIDFAMGDMYPDTIRQTPHYKRGKVYRQCFANQAYPVEVLQNISLATSNTNGKDVSSDYFPDEQIDISIDQTKDFIFLNVFNNRDWIPIGWTKVKNRKASFKYLEPEIVYMLTQYSEGEHITQHVPFLYKGAGICQFLRPDTATLLDTIKVYRKYPHSKRLMGFRKRLLGGEFQAANRADFKDAVLLHRIDTLPELTFQNVPVSNNKKFRYFRYVSGKKGYCEIAEVQFIENNEVLRGKVIGNAISYGNDPDIVKEALFDDDPLTFFSANDADGAWVGLDVGKPVQISKIRYIARNDDNNIRNGDRYELFYFSEDGWRSLGKQTGTKSQVLIYTNVPANALFWLRNYTRGQEERIFTYENGKQVWW